MPPTTPPVGGPTLIPKRRPVFLYVIGGLMGLVVVICATVAFTIWYLQRPIKPVVLSPQEKAVVATKLERLGEAGNGAGRGASPSPSRDVAPKLELDRPYVPGSKILRLTERELNGLLNANTDLGNTVRLELARDAINAYVAAPIPEDVPVMGGKIFRARGRFSISVSDDAAPFAILEDVTVFGLSLPKEWLGGVKGKNLLEDVVGDRRGRPVLKGVKSLRIEPGVLLLEVSD